MMVILVACYPERLFIGSNRLTLGCVILVYHRCYRRLIR